MKLKNYRLKRKDENFVGTVVDVKKDQYLALKIENKNTAVELGNRIELTTPEGKIKSMPLRSMKNISLHDIETVSNESIVLIPHLSQGLALRLESTWQKLTEIPPFENFSSEESFNFLAYSVGSKTKLLNPSIFLKNFYKKL